jgi:hypothetical protein
MAIGLVTGLLRLSREQARHPAADRLCRGVPLHAALVQIIWFYYAFPVVIGIDIPASSPRAGAVALYRRVLCRDRARRRQFDRARAMGCGALDRSALCADDAPGDPAAGVPPDDPALYEPVDHPA